MDVAILTAVIGAVAGIVGGTLSGYRQVRLEREKWQRGVSDAFTTELRTSVKELVTKLAAAAHSMCWLCWLAKFGANQLTQERINQYDEEMHSLLPQIMSSHAVIAGLDWEVYLKLDPLVDNFISLDFQIGEANLVFVPDEPASVNGLAKLYDEIQALKSSLPKVVSESIRSYSRGYASTNNQGRY